MVVLVYCSLFWTKAHRHKLAPKMRMTHAHAVITYARVHARRHTHTYNSTPPLTPN